MNILNSNSNSNSNSMSMSMSMSMSKSMSMSMPMSMPMALSIPSIQFFKRSFSNRASFFTPFLPELLLNPHSKVIIPKNCLNLYGLKFVFEKGSYRLLDCRYTLEELIKISETITTAFSEVNKRGFISLKSSTHPMFALIKKNLKKLGVKTSLNDFGSNTNTFS